MKKILLMLWCLCVLPSAAQEMRTVFLAMPDSLTPLLTATDKADFIDFLDSKMKAAVRNRFGKTAEMTELTADYAKVRMTEASTLELKLLPMTDTTKVVCVVKTVCAAGCDSEVRFYAADWEKELAAEDFLRVPDAGAFFLPEDSVPLEAFVARKRADVTLLKASLSAEEAVLRWTYDTPRYLGGEEGGKLSEGMRKEPIVMRWTDGRFVGE